MDMPSTRRQLLRGGVLTGVALPAVLRESVSLAQSTGEPSPPPAPSGPPGADTSRKRFPGFEPRTFERDHVASVGVVGGKGPPLLLLHGFPQTHLIWHKVAPALASRFTVVALDLRGYGDSGKPETDADHTPYSKRELALDVLHAMRTLGFDRFSVAGHDRGARVAHRLALDHPEAVDRLAVLDMAPTLAQYEHTDMNSARLWFHWFFLIQKASLPERLIGGDPDYFVRKFLGSGPNGLAPYPEDVIAEYVRCFRQPETVHGVCEEYRASAGIDLVHDRVDRGRKLQMPVLALWGTRSILPASYDVMALWRDYARDPQGAALECGHFLPEERPDEVVDHLTRFLT